MDSKRPKEGSISKVEEIRKGRKAGTPKTGGRQAGTPNKKTQAFAEALDEAGFDIAQAIVNLYSNSQDDYIKLSLIGLALKYKVPVPKPREEDNDIPEVETVPISPDSILKITDGKD